MKAMCGFLVVIAAILLSLNVFTRGAPAGTAPQFVQQPDNVTVYNSTQLECSVSGSPQPVVQWFHGETAVLQGGRLSIDPALGSLTISNAQSSDVGAYHCLASNSQGSVRSLTAFLELVPQTFIDIPSSSQQSISLVDFDPVSLMCLSGAIPPYITVSWSSNPRSHRVDTSLLSGELWFTYFDSTAGDVNNVYTCTVSNSITGQTQTMAARYQLSRSSSGPVFREARIAVPPPSEQTVVAGDNLRLECLPTGRPSPTVEWFKDGSPISVGGRVSTTPSGWGVTLRDTVSSDAGVYTCRATQNTNSGQSTLEASSSVTVIEPPQITASFPETTVNVTQSLTVSCSASATPPVEWEWLVNGEPVIMTTEISYTHEGVESVLRISTVSEDSGGVYQCRVCQPLTGHCDSANELVIAVSTPPMFTRTPDSTILAFAGEDVTLPCSAVGFPQPTFLWFLHSNIPLTLNERRRVSSEPGDCSLTINMATVGDTSLLSCRADNSAGSEVTPPTTLRVIAVPTSVTLPPPSLTPAQGTTVTLSCAIAPSDEYTISYQWFREDSLQSSGPTGIFTVTDFQDDDNGIYQCSALLTVIGTNNQQILYQVGSSTVTVGGPPSAPSSPRNLRYSNLSPTSFTAQWDTPMSNGGLPLRNYSVELLTTGSSFCLNSNPAWNVAISGIDASTTIAMITNLSPSFNYQFRVVAFTGEFQSLPSAAFSLTTPVSVPEAPPSEVRAIADRNQAGSLIVSWAAPLPCSQQGGPITAYTLQYRVQSPQGEWLPVNVGVATEYSLSELASATYEVRVAANTVQGQGIFSDIAMAVPSSPPAQFEAQSLNSSVRLSWSSVLGATGYIVICVHSDDGEVIRQEVSTEVTSLIVNELECGRQYQCHISANMSGEIGPQASMTVFLDVCIISIVDQPWFLPVVIVGCVVVIGSLLITALVFSFKCCCKCGKNDGKIYITSRRSASSLSGGSSGFSEYQHRQRTNPLTKSIKVHTSPTPSRRSTDYADMDSLQPAPSTAFTDSLRSNGRYPPRAHMTPEGGHVTSTSMFQGKLQGFIDDPNDHTHMYPVDEVDYPLNAIELESHNREFRGHNGKFRGHDRGFIGQEQHIRHLSGGVSQEFFDTLNRVHTPPAPHSQSPLTPSHTSQSPTPHSLRLSQETSDSWVVNSLNAHGHMTNNPMSRSSSNTSTAMSNPQFSSANSTPQKMDLGQRTQPGPLSPVREQLFGSHDHHMTQVSSVGNNPLRSNSTHALQSHSAGNIPLNDRLGGRSHSTANSHQIKQPPIGMELGTMTPNEIQRRELPPLPHDNHVVEYSTIPAGNPRSMYPPPTTSPPPPEQLPPPPPFTHSPPHYSQPTSVKRINYPDIEIKSTQPHSLSQPHNGPIPNARSSSPVYSAPQVKPKPLIGPPQLDDTLPAHGRFEQIPMTQRFNHTPHIPTALPTHVSQENSGTTSEESWGFQQQIDNDIQDLEALQNMLTPVFSDSQPNFEPLHNSKETAALSNGRLQFPINQQSHINRNTSAPGHMLASVKPPVAPKPLASSVTNLHTSRQSSREDPNSLAINKLRPSVPDLRQLDPRQPRKLQGKVRGAVWKPQSMNRVIESSSDSESDSDFSVADTVLGANDSTSLKSSHV